MPLLFIFFSIFNVATNGFSLQPISTNDPNSTEAKRYWFNNVFLTWGDDNLRPKCQRLDISVGSRLMTTNEGITYSLRTIYGQENAQKEMKQHSQLSYLNNILRNCRVKSVDVFLRKADDSVPPSHWWSWAFSYAVAEAECEVINEAGLFILGFSIRYETPAKSYDYVSIDDYVTHASVWWGTRLLDNYFNGILTMMSQLQIGPGQESPVFTNAQLMFYTERAGSVRDKELFKPDFYFLASDGSINNPSNHVSGPDQIYNNKSDYLSRTMTEGLFFAKTLYSLILVDLGEVQTSNLLLDPELLQYALDPQDNFNREEGGPLYNSKGLDWWKFQGISPPGELPHENNSVPMRQSYDKFKHQVGPLGTKAASIYSQYTCSVPVRKSFAGIILSMLITGFVLCQTAWTILKFMAEQAVSSSDSTAMYCEGCIAQGQSLVNMAPPYRDLLIPAGATRTSRAVSKSESTRELLQEYRQEDETTTE